MKWTETTDKNNPLSCRGEYCYDVPWLNHTTNGGMAYYSVRKDISGYWESMVWYGNRGHSVDNFQHSKTDIEAKEKCFDHMKKMFVEFSIQIGKILGR